jgi:hypothetical protein
MPIFIEGLSARERKPSRGSGDAAEQIRVRHVDEQSPRQRLPTEQQAERHVAAP